MHYLIVLVVLLTHSLAFGEDTNVGLLLNTMLQSKPQVKYLRTKTVIERGRCHGSRCEYESPDREFRVTEQVNDYARVASTDVILVKDLTFDSAKIVTLPERALLSSVDYQNCADGTLSTTVTLSVSGSRGFSVQKGKTVSTTKGASLTLSGSFLGGQAGTTFNVSESVGLSSSTTESYSTAETQSITTSMSVGTKKHGTIELLAYETTLVIPFSAVVEVDGSLEANASGITRASQMIGTAERTIPFTGTLRITGVSKGKVHTVPGKGNANCEGSGDGLTIRYQPTSDVPAINLPKSRQQAFGSVKEFFNSHTKRKSSGGAEVTFDESVIGPPDGIEYVILSITEQVSPTPACGFNDLGIPNIGIFSVEKRKYSNYSQGRLISSWIESVETFKSCWTP